MANAVNNYTKSSTVSQWDIECLNHGKRYGYPQCCIDAFRKQSPEYMKEHGATDDDRKRFRAAHIGGKFTGFIPCKYHAKQILAGQITLPELIKDRDRSLKPFPNEWSLK